MRRLLLLALLFVAPTTARADGLQGGGYPLDQAIVFRGCEATGLSCHQLTLHVADIAGQRFIVYDEMLSVFRPGVGGDWRPIGMFAGALPASCYAWFYEAPVTQRPATVLSDGRSGCENPVRPDWSPGQELSMRYILNDQDPSYLVAMTLTTTPEPASMVLMGTGLLMLVGVMRRLH